MSLTRRGFLSGVSALALSPTLPLVVRLEDFGAVADLLPIIKGDGIHDDWAGLQALLDGKPVNVPEGLVTLNGTTLTFGKGVFRVSRTLVFGLAKEAGE